MDTANVYGKYISRIWGDSIMEIFLVAYDLSAPEESYEDLLDALRKFDHCYAQNSFWLIHADGPSTALRSALAPLVRTGDKLFIDKVSDTWSGHAMPVCGRWLSERGL